MNANGVEFTSIALSIEGTGFDASARSFASQNHFDAAGIDCVLDGEQRTQIRAGFGYYSGHDPARTPSQLGSGSRRAFVILNGVTDSTSHQPWELLYSSNEFLRNDAAEVLALINAVMPGGGSAGGLSFAAWSAENGLPMSALPSGDDDQDALSNAVEFYLGTSPVMPNASPLDIERVDSGRARLTYTLGKNREGVTAQWEGSDNLEQWSVIDVAPDDWIVTEGGTVDSAAVTVPFSSMKYLRLSIAVSP